MTGAAGERGAGEGGEAGQHAALPPAEAGETGAHDVRRVQNVLDGMDGEAGDTERTAAADLVEGGPDGEGDEPRGSRRAPGQGVAQPDEGVGGVVEGEHQATTGTEHTRQLAKGAVDVGGVVEVVEGRRRQHAVEGAGAEGQRPDVGDDGDAHRRRGARDDRGRHVETDPGRRRERRQEGAVGLAFLEQVGLEPPARRSAEPAVDEVEVLAPRPAPPPGGQRVDVGGDPVPILHVRRLHHLFAPTAVAAAATVLAAALTLSGIGDKSLWYDEAFTVGLVDRPLGDALWRISHWELNQSPYYVLMLGWHALGDGESFLRLLSAVFAVATVPVVYAVGRRLADPWVGAIAAAVVAGHALVVQWGQQLRGYTLATLLVTLATLLLLRAVERPTTGRAVAYAVVAAATAYTHVVAGLVLAAHALSLLALRPIPWRLVKVAGSVGAVLVAPLAWYFLTRSGDPLAFIAEPSRRELVGTLADVAGGGNRHLLVLGGLALIGAVVARPRLGTVDGWKAMVPILWLAVPVLAVVVSTYTVKPLLLARYLVVVVPALALLVAWAVRRLPRVAGAAALAAVAAVSAQGVRDWYDVGSYEDWRGAVASVEASARSDDDVVAVPGRAVHAVRYYGPDLRTVSPTALDTAAGERLWLLDRRSQLGTERPVPADFDEVLAARYELVEERSFVNVDVRLYERR